MTMAQLTRKNGVQAGLSYLSLEQSDIFEGDCGEVLDRIRPKSVELIVTSPPYNIGKIYERGSRTSLEDYLILAAPDSGKARGTLG